MSFCVKNVFVVFYLQFRFVINFYITGTFLSPEHILTNFEQVVFELRAFLFLKNYASVKGWFDKERMKVGWVVRMLDTST